MKLTVLLLTLSLISGCQKGTCPSDPYEPFNRKVHQFNMAFDATMLRPPSRLYARLVPKAIRAHIHNGFNNIDLIPTLANDILQAQGKWVIKDFWRLAINSTLGIGGLVDVAQLMGLPPHYNDFGLTLAHWGDKNSPYLVLPLLGPSTVRDAMGWMYQFVLWTPYVYIPNGVVAFSVIGFRVIDIRTQLFDSEQLMQEAFDSYTFIRDAYLQHRQYLITGGVVESTINPQDSSELYVQEL